MADNVKSQVDILLNVDAQLQGIRQGLDKIAELKKAAQDTQGVLSSFKQSFMSGVGLGGGFAIGAKAATAMLEVVGAISGKLNEAVDSGVRFNATLESASLSISAVLRTFNGERFKTFGDAMARSAEMVDELKLKARETTATFEELLAGFQQTAGAMAMGRIPLEKQIDLLVTTSNAMAALGISSQELRQELTALMMGNIDKNARLAKTLGIDKADIEQAKKAGDLYGFLTKRMAEFATAGKMAMDTVAGLESNIGDVKLQAAADGTKEVTEAYKLMLREQLKYEESLKNVISLWGEIKIAYYNAKRMTMAAVASAVGPNVADRNAAMDTNAVAAYRKRAAGVANASEVDPLIEEGLNLSAQLVSTIKMKGLDKNEKAALSNLNDQLMADIRALDQERVARVQNNKLAQEEIEKAEAAKKLAEESSDLREAGVKKYEKAVEKSHDAEVALLKETAPEKFLATLAADRTKLVGQLKDSKGTDAYYLRGVSDPNDAQKEEARKAAAAYRLGIEEDIAKIDKEVAQFNEAADKKRIQDAKHVAALKKQEAADAAQLEIESAQRRLQSAKLQAQVVESNPFLLRNDKKNATIAAISAENAALDENIAKLKEKAAALKAANPDAAESLYKQARGYEDDKTANSARISGIGSSMGFTNELTANLVTLQDGFTTLAGTITGTVGSAIDGIAGSIDGLVMGTMTWGEALSNIGLSVVNELVSSFARMAAQWIVQHTIMAAVSRLFHTQEIAMTGAAEVAKTQVTVQGAATRGAATAAEGGKELAVAGIKGASAVASIPYVGPFLAIAAMAAIVAAGVKLLGGFADGGYTGSGGKYQPAGIVHAGEIVFSQADVARNGGVDAVESLRLGGASGIGVSGVVAGSGASAVGGDRTQRIVLVDDRDVAERLREDPSFDTHIVTVNRRNQHLS